MQVLLVDAGHILDYFMTYDPLVTLLFYFRATDKISVRQLADLKKI